MTDSVHSFGKSSLGTFFVVFIIVTVLLYLYLYIKNKKILEDKSDFNFSSKEGVFFVALLCFTALTIALIFYTMLPVFSELFGSKITLGTRPYNVVSIVFFTAIFMLAGLAPAVTFGITEPVRFLKVYLPALVTAFAVTAIVAVCGFSVPSALVLTFATTTMAVEFLILGGKALIRGGPASIFKGKRFYTAILIHIGLALTTYGVIYSAIYQTSLDKTGRFGGNFDFGRYNISIGDVEHETGGNYHSDYVPLEVKVGDIYLTSLYPELREYENNENVYGEVAYFSMPRGDLYAILQGFDVSRDMVQLKMIFQPLIIWIWVGCILMCVGAVIAVIKQ
jgi:cytochrome c-type biogenesis protein CcmF